MATKPPTSFTSTSAMNMKNGPSHRHDDAVVRVFGFWTPQRRSIFGHNSGIASHTTILLKAVVHGSKWWHLLMISPKATCSNERLMEPYIQNESPRVICQKYEAFIHHSSMTSATFWCLNHSNPAVLLVQASRQPLVCWFWGTATAVDITSTLWLHNFPEGNEDKICFK